jgi:hypothetical protein
MNRSDFFKRVFIIPFATYFLKAKSQDITPTVSKLVLRGFTPNIRPTPTVTPSITTWGSSVGSCPECGSSKYYSCQTRDGEIGGLGGPYGRFGKKCNSCGYAELNGHWAGTPCVTPTVTVTTSQTPSGCTRHKQPKPTVTT